MSLEASTFNSNDEIENFLAINYDIKPIQIDKVETGSANCFRIKTNKKWFFLKEIQSKYTVSDGLREIIVCDLLSSHIPTSRFIKTVNGQFLCTKKGHVIHLQEYINGSLIEPNNFDSNQLQQTAQTLARIHKHLDNRVVLPEGFPEGWFVTWKKEYSIEKYKYLKSKIKSSDPLSEIKKDICSRKIRLLEQCSIDPSALSRLTRYNSHGDYNCLQILFDKQSRIAGVIDFTSASRLPAVWEIIRSYTYCADECKRGNFIDLKRLSDYVKNYLSVKELSLYDITNMAEFYYLNLLRSSYGIETNDENLVAFSAWRTELCEYLSTQYNEISKYLKSEFAGTLH